MFDHIWMEYELKMTLIRMTQAEGNRQAHAAFRALDTCCSHGVFYAYTFS